MAEKIMNRFRGGSRGVTRETSHHPPPPSGAAAYFMLFLCVTAIYTFLIMPTS